MSKELAHGEITEAIIGSTFEVHHVLGYGFLEAVYRNAMADEYRAADEAQLLNELAATRLPVGLLINFGRRKVEFKRMAWNLGEP